MRIKKKYARGKARVFISRKKALRKLQLSLKDFRRLCILKGIYPREPSSIKKANKGSTENKIFYHLKDINFLTHEPIINKFREYKVLNRKITHAKAKRDDQRFKSLLESKQEFNIDHIVKERYPTFSHALKDLDDALCLCFAFSSLTRSKIARPSLIDACRRLTIEFLHYVIESNSLKKVFVSIKGIYYQAEIMGEQVTWIMGHERSIGRSNEMDFSVVANFVEFYTRMLSFVNYRLYKSIGLYYPPTLSNFTNVKDFFDNLDSEDNRIALLAYPLKLESKQEMDEAKIDSFVDNEINEKLHELQMLKTLFKGCNFFLNREVPKESLTLVIRACGGRTSWEDLPESISESSEFITHQIVDRNIPSARINRVYMQPQWVFDSFNARRLLPTIKYAPASTLPPHLSPFVDENIDVYIPQEKIDQLREDGKDIAHLIGKPAETNQSSTNKGTKRKSSNVPEMSVQPSKVFKENRQKAINEEGHTMKLREMMLPKKHKRVYNKIKFGIKRKRKELNVLENKRRKIDHLND